MTNSVPKAGAALTAILALTLIGCAGNPPRQATDTRSTQSTGVLDGLQAHQPKGKRGEQKAGGTHDEHVADTMSARIAAPAKQPDPSPAQLPTREPARIMRICIAPWEDAAGNLHGASHVLTEIAPRRRQMASVPGATAGTLLTPLQLEPRKAPAPDRDPKP
jgi:hypothetical protein